MRRKSRSTKKKNSFLPLILLIIAIQFILIIYLLPGKGKLPKIIPVKPAKAPVSIALKGRVAIVLDDWGNSTNNIAALASIKEPLTLAILPNLRYSRQVADFANSRGFEIILHLPLEPQERVGLEPNTITTNMSEKKITTIFNNDIATLPRAKGINNHMGSKATENSRVMRAILIQLKKKGLFFLDSFTSTDSICKDVASSVGVKYARRDVFLDNSDNEVAIRKQLDKLRDKSSKLGYAIAIGHDRKTTLKVLREEIPKMKKEGYRFLFVSELVK